MTDPGDGGIAVQVDHTDDAAVGALFARVEGESGRLDLLVNNAAAIHDDLTSPKPFWEKTLELADVLDVGLRSAYAASWHAASLLVRQDRGLIAFGQRRKCIEEKSSPQCSERHDAKHPFEVDVPVGSCFC